MNPRKKSCFLFFYTYPLSFFIYAYPTIWGKYCHWCLECVLKPNQLSKIKELLPRNCYLNFGLHMTN